MRQWGCAAALVVALGAAPSSANDSSASVAAGGLVLQRSDSIAMLNEDLYVSAEEIRVRYRFRNLRQAPLTTVVAFPMAPRVLTDEFGGDIVYPSEFHTSVDGKPVEIRLERKAIVKGRDVTAVLQRHKIPLAPDSIMTSTEAMDRLPKRDRDTLVRSGLAGEEEWDDDGRAMKKHLIPLWSVEEKYWWTQTFPAGRDVIIEHRYVPGAGGSVESPIAFPEFRGTPEAKAFIARYCIDRSFLAAVDARRSRGDGGPMMPDRHIDYILKTGANWAQPIGDFRLVVDKGKPGNLVSFCADQVRKISPIQFEVRRKNWRPDRDLHVLIIEPRR